MGTRGLTIVRRRWRVDEEFIPCAVIYRHWDSYPTAHGANLATFLDGLELINGIPEKPPERYANGPGRLAAQLVGYMQDEGHNPDLMAAVTPCGQEFEYYVDCCCEHLKITVSVNDGPMTGFGAGGDNCNKQVFSGTVEEFVEWIKKYGEEQKAETNP